MTPPASQASRNFRAPAWWWVFIVSLIVLFARRPQAFLRPEFWAEDFSFLLAAEHDGLTSFFAPQAGYLHFIPRTIAWFGSFLDPFLQPGFYLLGWLTVMFAVIFACLSPRHHLPLKPWLALAVLIVPHTGEVFFTPTNAQWVAALGLLLTSLKDDPVKPSEWFADLAFLVFAGLSGPFIFFALPLFLLRVWQRRTARSFALAGLATVLTGVQGWFVAHLGADPEFAGPFSLLNLFATVSYRLVCNVFFGAWITGEQSPVMAVAVACAVLAFLGFAAWRSPRRAEFFRLLGFIVLLLAATTVRKRFDLWGWGDIGNGDRYFFGPKVILLWLTLIVLVGQPRRWVQGVLVTLLLCGVVSNVSRFKFEPFSDTHWYERCPDIRAHLEVEVEINPDWKYKYRRVDR